MRATRVHQPISNAFWIVIVVALVDFTMGGFLLLGRWLIEPGDDFPLGVAPFRHAATRPMFIGAILLWVCAAAALVTLLISRRLSVPAKRQKVASFTAIGLSVLIIGITLYQTHQDVRPETQYRHLATKFVPPVKADLSFAGYSDDLALFMRAFPVGDEQNGPDLAKEWRVQPADVQTLCSTLPSSLARFGVVQTEKPGERYQAACSYYVTQKSLLRPAVEAFVQLPDGTDHRGTMADQSTGPLLYLTIEYRR